jgi:RHS repeat-associated protein
MAAGDGSAASAPMYFVYDGWNLVEEGNTPWSPTRFYIQGGRVDEIVQSYNSATGLLAYHYYDASGHCTLLTDGQGTMKEQFYYDAFGKPYFYSASNNWTGELGSSSHGNRFLFSGREWLSDLHVYDFRNRLYQPELGRFLQPDPKEFAAGDYNLYRYCHNDPVNRNDPTGLYAIGSGLTPEQTKQVDDAQRTAADKLDRGLLGVSPHS